MSIEDLGSIGELVAAIATIATLIYLAIQIKQNTRAVKSATFQNITTEMANNVEPIMSSADLAAIIVKGTTTPSSLTPEERIRMAAMFLATFRRMESVFVQNQLGSIEDDLMEGFEVSMTSILKTQFGREWWDNAKATFYEPFVARMDERVNFGDSPLTEPSILMKKGQAPEQEHQSEP